MRLPLPTAAGERWVKEMAQAVEWLPEEWPEGIPNLKQLLVVAPLTTSILLLLDAEIATCAQCGQFSVMHLGLFPFAHYYTDLSNHSALATPSSRPPAPSFRTEQADFFFPLRSCEAVGLRREKSLFSLPYSAPCLHPFPHQRFAFFFPPYNVTLPSTTLPTYRPAERNCITLCPFLASCAHRDSVFGFCSSPRKACPSNTKSTSRSRFRGVSRTASFFPSSSTSAAPSISAT